MTLAHFLVRIFSRDKIKKNDKGEEKVYARTRTRTPLDWSRKLISVQDMNDIQSMRVGRQTVEEGSTFFFSLFFSFFLFFSVGQLPRRKRKTSSTCVVGLSFEIRWYGWSHARKPAKDLVPRWAKRSLSGRKNTTGQWLTANSKFDRFPELFFFFFLSQLAFSSSRLQSEASKTKKKKKHRKLEMFSSVCLLQRNVFTSMVPLFKVVISLRQLLLYIFVRVCMCVCLCVSCFNTETRVREGEGRGVGRRLILQKLVRFSPRELERNTSVPTKFSRNT